MRFKKMGILFMIMVLALTGVGVGFAHWFDTVTIIEEVNTGTVIIGIRDMGTTDDPYASDLLPNPYGPAVWPSGYPWVDPGWNGTHVIAYNKDVASTISVNGTIHCVKPDGRIFYDSVTETLTNCYPSYAPTIAVELTNCGTIPVKITWKPAGMRRKSPGWSTTVCLPILCAHDPESM